MTRVGIDIDQVRALDQAHREPEQGVGAPGWPVQKFQQLPTPNGVPPFRVTSKQLGLASPIKALHLIGDTGGIGKPGPQEAVAAAMIADLEAHPEISAALHVGDVGYFNGEVIAFETQFFQAYAKYLRPIIACPGNHDTDPLPGSAPLAEFMAVFCSPAPVILSGTEEYGRETICQPNCYWTLLDPAVTIISLATNVPSGGQVEADQAAWFEGELAAAPTGIPLIVNLHHPPYSADAHHGGSARMGKLLDSAFIAANRWPQVVVSGHVHNRQRFVRVLADGTSVTYLVGGAGGYPHKHAMAGDATVGMSVTADTTLEQFEADLWGFDRLTFDGMKITGEYTGVAEDGTVTPAVDSF